MPFVLVTALKDAKRRLADPAALLFWLGVPVVLGSLMTIATGGGSPPKAHLLLGDEGQSLSGALLTAAARQGQFADLLEIDRVSVSEGRRRIDAGEGSALLVLPAGLDEAVLNDRAATLTLISNPSERILPLIIEELLGIVVEAEFYVQRLFAEPLRQFAAARAGLAAPSDEVVAAISRAVNQNLQPLQRTLLPPILALETQTAAGIAPVFDFRMVLLPSMLFMSVLFIAQGMSLDLWIEKDKGTLRRAISSPQPLGAFLGGKVVAGAVMTTLVGLLAVAIAVGAYHVPLARAPLAVAWAGFSGAALFCFFLLLQVFTTSQRGASLLSTLAVFPLMMIGGSFFPFEILPSWMAAIGRWTPNGIAVTEMKAVLFGDAGWHGLVLAAAGLGVPAAVAFAWTVRRLARGFATT